MNPIPFKNDQYTWGGGTWMEILQGVEQWSDQLFKDYKKNEKYF